MSFFEKIEHYSDKPFTTGIRTLVALILSPSIFYLGMMKYSTNDFFMPIWERDFSGFIHGITGGGHSKTEVLELPVGVVGAVAALMVGFMFLKEMGKYPSRINLQLLVLLFLDFMVFSTLINIFLFSGTGFEFIYYCGAFIAGVYFFGDRVTSQLSILGLILLVLIRLIYIDSMYLYIFWLPIMILIYIVLRAPFEAESYRSELRDFSFNKMIGKG